MEPFGSRPNIFTTDSRVVGTHYEPRKVFILLLGLFAPLVLPLSVTADEQYTLAFIQTQNAPAGAKGAMALKIYQATPRAMAKRSRRENVSFNSLWMGNSSRACAEFI